MAHLEQKLPLALLLLAVQLLLLPGLQGVWPFSSSWAWFPLPQRLLVVLLLLVPLPSLLPSDLGRRLHAPSSFWSSSACAVRHWRLTPATHRAGIVDILDHLGSTACMRGKAALVLYGHTRHQFTTGTCSVACAALSSSAFRFFFFNICFTCTVAPVMT